MQIRYILILLSVEVILFSCEKEGTDTLTVEGFLKDNVSGVAITGVTIYIDAIKSSSGMGIITSGKRKFVGKTITDSKGYYKIKLRIFEEAERLEFYVNPGQLKQGYVEKQQSTYLSDMNRHGNNHLNFTVSPTGLVRITFRNAQPISDSDFFYFGWYDSGDGWTRGIVQKENCGTVAQGDAFTWTGKDVCGMYTVETIAEGYTHVYWTVKKDGATKQYYDSVYVKRAITNEFSLNY